METYMYRLCLDIGLSPTALPSTRPYDIGFLSDERSVFSTQGVYG